MIPRTFIHDCIIIGIAALVLLYLQDVFGQTKEVCNKPTVKKQSIDMTKIQQKRWIAYWKARS